MFLEIALLISLCNTEKKKVLLCKKQKLKRQWITAASAINYQKHAKINTNKNLLKSF